MIVVEQAVYGEVKSGHGLREASGDRALALALASRLDLPDTAPPGVEWSPYVSGFPFGTSYVLARTFRDPSATRAGMVLSHALILPLDLIINIEDLRPFFRLLITEPIAPKELSTLSFIPDVSPPATMLELPTVAAALIARGAKGPVVHSGLDDFDSLIASLWWHLWPTLRRNFSFRLSFGPGDLVETPVPAIVCIPSTLAVRWQGHRILEHFVSASKSLASGMLCGDETGKPLRAFAEAIGAELASFGDLQLLEQAYRFAELEADLFGNTLAAVRLTEHLSPHPTCGEKGKSRLVCRLILQLEHSTPKDALQMRNLKLQGFAQAGEVWNALTQRLANSSYPASHDTVFMSVLADAVGTNQVEGEWRQAILEGLKRAASGSASEFSSALWRWAKATPALTERIWMHLGIDRATEKRLVQVAPRSLDCDAAKPILEHALKNGMYQLHGAAAAASYPPIEAVRMQVRVEPLTSSEGIRCALRWATSAQMLECALNVDDIRLIPLAAHTVAKNPELLASVDISLNRTRTIWSMALEANPEVWHGPSNPRAAFDQVLSDFLDGADENLELISHLSNTPVGNLSDFPRRSELWSKIPNPIKENLLNTSAQALIKNAENGLEIKVVEPILRDAVLSSHELDKALMRMAKGSVGRAVRLVKSLGDFPEARFRSWLATAITQTSPLPIADAQEIGALALQHRWRSVSEDLLKKLRQGREDVRPALRVCTSLLRLLDRLFLGLNPASAAEKWDALLELASELYPTGPDHDGLWERAGGMAADLTWTGNGRSRWQSALNRIRYGGSPRISYVLSEMLRDYENNQGLRYLADDPEFKFH